VLEALVIVLAIFALAFLPCVIFLILCADELIESTARALRRARKARLRVFPEPTGPPLQQIAEELHRLGGARRASAPGSVRHVVTTRAYDRRLEQACAALQIEHHLTDLDNLDLDLERLRVEGALLAAGFVLANIDVEADVDGRQDHC